MRRSFIRISVILIPLAAVVGCGSSGFEGTYSGKGTGFLQQMVFKPDGKVELTFMGMTREGTYEVEGKKVKVTNAGTTEILTISDNGCLEGGGILGRYCKEGAAATEAPTANASAGLSGTWEARHPQGSIALAFVDSGNVRITITEGGRVDSSADGTYSMRGDRVTRRRARRPAAGTDPQGRHARRMDGRRRYALCQKPVAPVPFTLAWRPSRT